MRPGYRYVRMAAFAMSEVGFVRSRENAPRADAKSTAAIVAVRFNRHLLGQGGWQQPPPGPRRPAAHFHVTAAILPQDGRTLNAVHPPTSRPSAPAPRARRPASGPSA